jgi:phosphatidylinositol-3-phosphatase
MKYWAWLLIFSGLATAQVPSSKHVWIVTEENHSFEDVIGNAKMPYYNSIAAQHGLATEYYSNQHNSLRALMWLVAGKPVTANDETTSCFDVNNIVRGVLSLGLTWKSYQVDLPYPGFDVLSSEDYVRRHNPLIDFTDSCSGEEALKSVPFTQLKTDMRNNDTPNYIYITPDLDEDAHDGTLAEADQWLEHELPTILARPEFEPGGDGLLFVVWDEGNLTNDNRCSAKVQSGCGGRLATLVIGPQVRPHYRSSIRYDHTNLLRTVCDAMGVTACPGEAAVALPMVDFFNTVNIIAPLSNARVASPVHILADTNNSSPVTAVQVYVDDSLEYEVDGPTLDTMLAMSPGTHRLGLQSRDAIGGIHKSETVITVLPEAVVVTLPLPRATVSSPVSVVATAGGTLPVNKMQIYLDDRLVYQANTSSLKARVPMSDGSHHLVVQARDESGGVTKDGFDITVAQPAITITSPGTTAESPVGIVATAHDPIPIAAIQVYVDNVLRYEYSGTGLQIPLSIADGTHSLAVEARDIAGGIYKKSKTVTIKPVPVDVSIPVDYEVLGYPMGRSME